MRNHTEEELQGSGRVETPAGRVLIEAPGYHVVVSRGMIPTMTHDSGYHEIPGRQHIRGTLLSDDHVALMQLTRHERLVLVLDDGRRWICVATNGSGQLANNGGFAQAP